MIKPKHLKKILDIPQHKRIHFAYNYDFIFTRILDKLIEAIKKRDSEMIAELNELKEFFENRKFKSKCSGCGATINKGRSMCTICHRKYNK